MAKQELTLKKLCEVLGEWDKKYIPDTGWVMGKKMYDKFKKLGWIDENNNFEMKYSLKKIKND